MSSYNLTRWTRQVLKRFRKEPPSLVLHLYPTHFRFEQQHGNFPYDSPMKCFLEAIREQKLPTDLLDVLDEAGVRYYEGCLIVEVHDHRSAPQPTPSHVNFGRSSGLALSFQLSHTRDQQAQALSSLSKAEVYRIVLGPNPATLWTELGIMEKRIARERLGTSSNLGGGIAMKEGGGGGVGGGGKGTVATAGGTTSSSSTTTADVTLGWTEDKAVEMEALILNCTTPALCLSPSIQTSRIANAMLRATTLRPPRKYLHNKRKRIGSVKEDGIEGDEEEGGEEALRREREERERMMKIGDQGVGRGRSHAFARLAFIQAYRERQNQPVNPAMGNGTPKPSTRPASAIASATAAATNASRASTPIGTAGSPPSIGNSGTVSTAPPPKKKKKKESNVNGLAGTPVAAVAAGDGSEVGTPAAGSPAASATASSKKSKKPALPSTGGVDLNDPSLPSDPIEREKAIAEKKRLLTVKKRAEAKARQKEKKKLAEQQAAAAAAAGDLQVNGGSTTNGVSTLSK